MSRRVVVVAVIQNILFLHPEGTRLHPVKARLMLRIAKITSRWIQHSISVSPLAARLWKRATGLDSVVLAEGIDPTFAGTNEAPLPRSLCIMTGTLLHKEPDLAQDLATTLLATDGTLQVTIVGVDVTSFSPEAAKAVLDGRLTALSSVAPADLAILFARSEVVVIPSRIESFGLPAFEARASGSRVVVGRDTPMYFWLREDEGVVAADSYDLDAWKVATLDALSRAHVPPNTSFMWDAIGDAWAEQIVQWASAGRNGGDASYD